MKLSIKLVCLVFILAFLVPTINASEVADPAPPLTLKELAQNYTHVFIGQVESKTIGANYTHYTFNVSEWLKNPIETSSIKWTENGGSMITHNSMVSLYPNVDFIVVFDEYNGTHIQGSPRFKLRNSYTESDIESLRRLIELDENPSPVEGVLVVPQEAVEAARKALEEVRKAQEAEEAASTHVEAVPVTPPPTPEEVPEPSQPNLLPPYLIVMSFLLVLLLYKLTRR